MIRITLAFLATLALATPLRAAVDIQEVTSPGGITAWLVEERSIPFVALEIQFLGGSSLDPEGKRGAVNLMTGLIEEGAGDMDARAFAAARDGLAASYSFDSNNDSVSVSAQFLTENRGEAVALLREALVNPRFDQDAIDRVRAQVISNIRSDATDPNSIAGITFAARSYGEDDPYGTDRNGTVNSVSGLTREDMIAAHRATLVRDRVYVGASGDISAEDLGLILDQLLGDLPESNMPLVPDVTPNVGGGIEVVPFDTPQSVAIFGHEGIDRDDPDFFAAFVANEIFGGNGRLSRLGFEVREERGLTYGIGAFLANYDRVDMLLGQFASANDRVGEAIDVIKDEWARIAAEGVTEKELDEVKTYLTGAYPLRFDGNSRIAGIMVGMQSVGLSPNYIETRNDRINAVTLEDVRRVAAELYQPENLRFIVVGQPTGLDVTQ